MYKQIKLVIRRLSGDTLTKWDLFRSQDIISVIQFVRGEQ